MAVRKHGRGKDQQTGSSYGESTGLQLGWYLDEPERIVEVFVDNVAAHVALLAQSGAGKSFFLGRLLEEILLKTRARLFIVDANGDFRSFHEASDKPWSPEEMQQTTWDTLPKKDYRRLSLFETDWQAKLRFAHLTMRKELPSNTEYATWIVPRVKESLIVPYEKALIVCQACRYEPTRVGEIANEIRKSGLSIAPTGRLLSKNIADALAKLGPLFFQLAAANTGIPEAVTLAATKQQQTERGINEQIQKDFKELGSWGIWTNKADEDVSVVLSGKDCDVCVLDCPSFSTPDALKVVLNRALASIWNHALEQWELAMKDGKHPRTPTFIVIDEAHNFAPQTIGDPLTELLAAKLVRIAAEGRKYGLYLILATQRPAKVRDGLLAECENVCSLRLRSPMDHEIAARTWGVPIEEIQRTRYFKKGDGLLFGRWVPSTTAFHTAYRRTKEGGASLPREMWALPRKKR